MNIIELCIYVFSYRPKKVNIWDKKNFYFKKDKICTLYKWW